MQRLQNIKILLTRYSLLTYHIFSRVTHYTVKVMCCVVVLHPGTQKNLTEVEKTAVSSAQQLHSQSWLVSALVGYVHLQ